VRRDELRVEQPVAACPQACHEVDERHLAGICCTAEHAFTKECSANRGSVEPADQVLAIPDLHAVCVTCLEKLHIGSLDRMIDPGNRPILHLFCAKRDHLLEGLVDRDSECRLSHRAREPARNVEQVEGQDTAPLRINPADLRIFTMVSHREDTLAVDL